MNTLKILKYLFIVIILIAVIKFLITNFNSIIKNFVSTVSSDDKTSTSGNSITTDDNGNTVISVTDPNGQTRQRVISPDGKVTIETVFDQYRRKLSEESSTDLEKAKRIIEGLAIDLSIGAARDLFIVALAGFISRTYKEGLERGVKNAIQQGGKVVSRIGTEMSMKFMGYITKEAAERAAENAFEFGIRKAAREAAVKVLTKEYGFKTFDLIPDGTLRQIVAEDMEKAALKAANEKADSLYVKLVSKLGPSKAASRSTGLVAKGVINGVTSAKSGYIPKIGPLGASLIAYDIVSIVLDTLGCGGFKEGPFDNSTWTKEKEIFDSYIKDLEKEASEGKEDEDPIRFPIIAGPLDKFDQATLILIKTDIFNNQITRYANTDPYLIEVFTKLKNEIDLGRQFTDEELSDYISDNINPAFEINIMSQLCKDYRGKTIIDNNTDYAGCSYNTQTECEQSFRWPIVEANDSDIYATWDNTKQECYKDPLGHLMNANCDGQQFPYDKTTKLCKLDQNYCLRKGMKWDGTNCKLSTGQEIAEMLFGTTTVRGLNALYNENQYEPCPPGSRPAAEIATVAGVTMGLATGILCYFTLGALCATAVGATTLGATYLGQTLCATDECPEGQEKISGLCYDQCRDGYDKYSDAFGNTFQGRCYRCPDGFKKSSAGLCIRDGCPEGQERGSGFGSTFCYRKCTDLYGPEYTENDGAGICKKSCPDGYNTDDLTCHRLARIEDPRGRIKNCPDGWVTTVEGPGGMCQEDCTARGGKLHLGTCYAKEVDLAELWKFPNLNGNCPTDYIKFWDSCWAKSYGTAASEPIREIGVCPVGYPNSDEGMCYEDCSKFGPDFNYIIGGTCRREAKTLPRTQGREVASRLGDTVQAEWYDRENRGISYKVFPKKRKIPFGRSSKYNC